MTDPSNPNYAIAKSMPVPNVPPDHTFFKGSESFCERVVTTLDSGYPVYCGLRRNQHPPYPKIPAWQEWKDA